MALFAWLLVAVGITTILTEGKIFSKVRDELELITGSKVWHCSMCVGFWVGFFMSLLGHTIPGFDGDIHVWRAFWSGAAASAAAWTHRVSCFYMGSDKL